MVSCERIPRPSILPPRRLVPPRPLVPVYPPRTLPALPSLPSPARSPDFGHSYTLTTHIIPSSLPRTTPDVPPPLVPKNEGKDERRARIKRQMTEFLETKMQYERGELMGARSEKVLWNVVNRYVRKDAGKGAGITLFMGHANGLHKETFEPMLHHLFTATASNKFYQIDEVWTFDAVQHGDSALLNAANLGVLFDWIDHTRDILNFFLHYLPDSISSALLPVHLPRVSSEISEARRTNGFRQRTLVTIGHSYGGTSLTLAAHNFPELFSGLVLVDPVIIPAELDRTHALQTLTFGALGRRESWSSREEASRLLKTSPFFGRWESDVFQLYIDHALTTLPSGETRLKCPGVQEAAVFTESQCPREAWTVLDNIPEHIAVQWIVCDTDESVVPVEEFAVERVWKRPANTSNVRMRGVGHLMIQEAPREVAEVMHGFLLQNFGERKARL